MTSTARHESKHLGSQTCTRCKGSGTYSDIGVCFLCGGTGRIERYTKLTKDQLAHNAQVVQTERDAEDAAFRARMAARKAARQARKESR